MFNKQLVRDLYGQYYKIHTSREKLAPHALEPEKFYSESQASRFINNLIAPESYWSGLYHSESLTLADITCNNALKTEIAELLCSGRLKVYAVESLSTSGNSAAKRTLVGDNKDRYTFTHASTLLVNEPEEVLKFTDKKSASELLSSLSPDISNLQEIVDGLNLPKTELDNDAGELSNLVAEGLASGEIVVLLDKYTTPPSASENSEGDVHGDKDASKGPNKPECTFDLMTISCSHYPKDRNYQLDVINNKPNLNGVDKALQVIAKSDNPDKIKIDFAGTCSCGNKECPSITIESESLNKSSNKSPFEFESVPLDEFNKVNTFTDFIKYCLIPDISGLSYQTYTISRAGCNGAEGSVGKIHAFPTFKWSGNVSFGYFQKDGSQKKTNNNAKDSGEWKLEAGLDGEIGNQKFEFKSTNKNKTEDYFPSLKSRITDFIEKLDDIATQTDNLGQDVSESIGLTPGTGKGLLQFKATWPKISIGGSLELKESTKDFNVDVGGDISLAMSPLIGAEVRSDILSWIIRGFGPQAMFLEDLRERIKDKAEIAVDIIVNGQIDVNLKWNKNADEKWLTTEGEKSGEASAGVFLGLEARARAEVSIFFVKITVGLEVHMKGNTDKGPAEGIGIIGTLYSTTNDDYPSIGGRFTFTGIAIYFSYYAEIGSSESSSDDVKNQTGTGRNINSDDGDETPSNELSAKEQKLRKIDGILEPWQYPEKPDKGSGHKIKDIGI